VVEIKDKESNPDSESDYENTSKRQIINANPIAIVTTLTIQPEEPIDPEEGEHLFHSQMWVKGTPLHFVVESIGHQIVGIINNTTPISISHRVASPCQPTMLIVIQHLALKR
jgi:hypothetical protein